MKTTQRIAAFCAVAALSLAVAPTARAATPDGNFIRSAASANRLEIAAGKLAVQRASSKKWQSFGREMVRDHTAALGQIQTLARLKRLALSGGMMSADQSAYQSLARMRGSNFDSAYSRFALSSHVAANGLYNQEIAYGRDSDVRSVASKQLPTVQNHLMMVDRMTGTTDRNLSAGVPKP